MRKILTTLSIGILIALTGCFTKTVEAKGSPIGTHTSETIHTSFYNFDWGKDYEITKTKGYGGLYRVNITNNYFYSLVSVLSLGLYTPISIEYWEQAEKPKAYNGETW